MSFRILDHFWQGGHLNALPLTLSFCWALECESPILQWGEESPFQQYLRRFNGCKLEVEVSNNWKVKISKFSSGGENLFGNNLDDGMGKVFPPNNIFLFSLMPWRPQLLSNSSMYHSSAKFLNVQNVLCNATLPGLLPTRGSLCWGRLSIFDWGLRNRVPGLPRVSTTKQTCKIEKAFGIMCGVYRQSQQLICASTLQVLPDATADCLQVHHGNKETPNNTPLATNFIWHSTPTQKCHVMISKTRNECQWTSTFSSKMSHA
jgi:hypothetical protein